MLDPAAALVLRPATDEDVDDIVTTHLQARAAAPMPASVHGAASVREHVRAGLDRARLWVAELDGEVVGYARFTSTWLDDLYVSPDHSGAGIGSALLDLVKSLLPDGFSLWVFASNRPARDFYAGHGLLERELTDGSGNEERKPDIRMQWHPR